MEYAALHDARRLWMNEHLLADAVVQRIVEALGDIQKMPSDSQKDCSAIIARAHTAVTAAESVDAVTVRQSTDLI